MRLVNPVQVIIWGTQSRFYTASLTKVMTQALSPKGLGPTQVSPIIPQTANCARHSPVYINKDTPHYITAAAAPYPRGVIRPGRANFNSNGKL